MGPRHTLSDQGSLTSAVWTQHRALITSRLLLLLLLFTISKIWKSPPVGLETVKTEKLNRNLRNFAADYKVWAASRCWTLDLCLTEMYWGHYHQCYYSYHIISTNNINIWCYFMPLHPAPSPYFVLIDSSTNM